MWWFDPPVTKATGADFLNTDVRENHLGRNWQRWSRHLEPGQWKSGVDRLENYVALIRSEDRPRRSGDGMTCTLVLTDALAEEIRHAANDPLETAGVLLATLRDTGGGSLKLIARKIEWVPQHAYRVRRPDALSIGSDGYVPALQGSRGDRRLRRLVSHASFADRYSPAQSA